MLSLVLAMLQPADLDLMQIDELAVKRDETGMGQKTLPELNAVRPFRFFSVPGVYGGGRKGWRAVGLVQPNGPRKWIVFTTPTDAEDIGEQVFEFRNGKLIAKVDETDTFGLKPLGLTMNVTFAPAEKSVSIEATLKVQEFASASSTFFMLRLAPNVTVTSVQRNGKSLNFTQAGGTLCIPMIPKSPGTSDYQVTYHGVFNDPPQRGSIDENEGVLTGANWWPSLGRLPITTHTTIVTPSDWIAITHGNKVSETVVGNQKTTVYHCDRPFSVLSLSAGRYKWFEKAVNGRKYWIAARNMTKEDMELQCDFNAAVLTFYDTIYKYPFAAFGDVFTPRFGSGALEAYSYATYQQGWLPELEPHEPSHNLFGGIVPNTYLGSMWNESFATFFEDYFLREAPNGNRSDLRLAFAGHGGADNEYNAWPGISASCEVGPFAYAIGYARGGKVLNMLEQWMGEDRFKKAVVDFVNNHTKGEPGSWEDFERAVNRQPGANYSWFFDQWLRRPGYLEFGANNWLYADGKLTANIQFTGSPYRFQLDVLTIDANGKETLTKIDVPNSPGTQIQIPLLNKPKRVILDPYLRLLRPINRNESNAKISDARFGTSAATQSGSEDNCRDIFDKRSSKSIDVFPDDPSGTVVFGNPLTLKGFKEFLAANVPELSLGETSFTYHGVTQSYDKGGFAARIELAEGKTCYVGFGKVRATPNFGSAATAIFDDLGRVLAARTNPKRTGPLCYDVP